MADIGGSAQIPEERAKQMAYKVGIDAGGTFTDTVVVDEKGAISVFKAPSTPQDPGKGVYDTLELAAKHYGLPLRDFMANCEMVVHGTTVATNAVIQHKAAKTGLICTRGFTSILHLREGAKPEPFNLNMEYPKPYVPRYLTLPVEERVNSEGEVVIPLNEDDVRKAIRQFKDWNVQAVAVCLLWSIRNPSHEQKIARIIEQEWPAVAYSLSSEVLPVIREYPRTSATVVDASLKPVMRKYTDRLQQSLSENGFRREFLMVIASGGVVAAKSAVERPVFTVLSGPAMGPVAGLLYGQTRGVDNVITVDMGGTSFDMSIVTEGRIATTRGAKVADVPVGVNTLEVDTIGAGGGSIAWVDAGGLLHVGPQSAGAVPGPACYEKGGEEPTVTDANVILGYINPDYFLGGRMRINPALSHRAMEKVARRLGLGIAETAEAVMRVVNQNMISGMEHISVKRGMDPREYLFVCGGGATAIHAGEMARELDMKQVLVPRTTAALCALGMLTTDIKFDSVGSLSTSSLAFDFARVNRVLDDLEAKGKRFLKEEGVDEARWRFDYFANARYPRQSFELEVPLRSSRLSPDSIGQLVQDFHDHHERTYAVSERSSQVEFTDWRVVATGVMPKITLPVQSHGGADATHALKGRRKAYFKALGGFADTPIYEGPKLVHGNKLKGAAVIEEPTTTIVVWPGWEVTVTENGDYFMELG